MAELNQSMDLIVSQVNNISLPDDDLIIYPQAMTPVTAFGSEIDSTGVIREKIYENIDIMTNQPRKLEQSIFSNAIIKPIGMFDPIDIYVNPNDTLYNGEIPERYKERGYIPLFNPDARGEQDIRQIISEYKLRGLGPVRTASKFKNTKDGENAYNYFDLWRNWDYILPRDDFQYLPVHDYRVHGDEKFWLEREDISGNEKILQIIFPPSRVRTLKWLRAEEINRIYNDDTIIIQNYKTRNNELRRQLTSDEHLLYRCMFCSQVAVFPIVCQSHDRKPGEHYFCYPCVYRYLEDREKAYCAEIEADICPYRHISTCGNWLTYSNNARPSDTHRETMLVQLSICQECRFRAPPLRMSSHVCEREFAIEMRPFEFSKNENRLKKYKDEIKSYKLENKELKQKLELAESNETFRIKQKEKRNQEKKARLSYETVINERQKNEIVKIKSEIKYLREENEKLKSNRYLKSNRRDLSNRGLDNDRRKAANYYSKLDRMRLSQFSNWY